MLSRQPRIHVGLRLVAAGCIVLWLMASWWSSLPCRCGEDHHAETCPSETLAHHDNSHAHEAEAAEDADCDAGHPHDGAESSHNSYRDHDGGNCCCSTVMPTAQIATPVVIIKPAPQPLDFLCTVHLVRNPMLVAPGDKTERQTKDRDRVFKPEVCLCAAHRSLAPPSLA